MKYSVQIFNIVIVGAGIYFSMTLRKDGSISFFQGDLILLGALLFTSIMRWVVENSEVIVRVKGLAIIVSVFAIAGLTIFLLDNTWILTGSLYWILTTISIIIFTSYFAHKIALRYTVQNNSNEQAAIND